MKTYTLAQANALLPAVVPLVQQLQALQHSIVQTNQQLDELIHKLSGGNGFPIQSLQDQIQGLTKHQLQLIEAFQSAMTSLQELGCELKDLSMGVVDFYGVRQDQVVCLCWKMGEEQIRFWHALEAGYAGRQPIETL